MRGADGVVVITVTTLRSGYVLEPSARDVRGSGGGRRDPDRCCPSRRLRPKPRCGHGHRADEEPRSAGAHRAYTHSVAHRGGVRPRGRRREGALRTPLRAIVYGGDSGLLVRSQAETGDASAHVQAAGLVRIWCHRRGRRRADRRSSTRTVVRPSRRRRRGHASPNREQWGYADTTSTLSVRKARDPQH